MNTMVCVSVIYKEIGVAACDKLSDPWDRPYVFPLSYTDSLTFPRVEGSDSGMFYSSY